MRKSIIRIFVLTALLFTAATASAQFGSVDDKIWAFVKKEYPDDVRMQEYQFKKQKDAFVALYDVKDYEVKRIAEKEFRDDYIKQLDVYNKQSDAKAFMQGATDKKAKEQAVKLYPADYEMQKRTYEELIK
jgi:hypothetical protein